MTLYRLALKNLQTQRKNYLIYSSSIAVAVMVYSSFISMSLNPKLIELVGADYRIDSTLKGAGVLMLVFIVIFMNSANNFLIRKRKKEIALYNLFGMRRYQVAQVFFIENMFVGALSLLVGIFSGILLSKLFSMILFKAIGLNRDSDFFFSMQALKNTVIVFLLILLLLSIKSAYIVYRYKLLGLFKAVQTKDKESKINFFTWFFGIVGLALLGIGYCFAVKVLWLTEIFYERGGGEGSFILVCLLILGLCIAGTYLIFYNFLALVLFLLKKNPFFYYKGIRMISLGNLSFHLRKNAQSLATIAIVCGTALAAIAGASAVYSYSMKVDMFNYPFEFSVSEEQYKQVVQVITKNNYQVINQTKAEFKLTGAQFEVKSSVDGISQPDTYNEIFDSINVLSASTYKQLRKNQKYLPEITIKNERNVFLFLTDFPYSLKSFDYRPKIQLADQLGIFSIEGVYFEQLMNIGIPYSEYFVVVSDNVYKKLDNNTAYTVFGFNVGPDKDLLGLSKKIKKQVAADEIVATAISDYKMDKGALTGSTSIFPQEEVPKNNNYTSYKIRKAYEQRATRVSETLKSFGLIIYMAIFASLLLLMITGSIIMLRQLSDAEEEKIRYKSLRKIGVQKETIRKSIYQQNFFVFFLPLTISILDAAFANYILSLWVGKDVYLLAYVSCGCLILFYGIFYLITSYIYDKKVNEDDIL